MTANFFSALWSFASRWSSAAPQLWNHLWQSTLFAAAVALLALALRRYPARVRYWLWMAASLKFLIPFSFLIAAGTHFARPAPPTPSETSAYAAVGEMSEPFTDAPALAAPIPMAPAHMPTRHLSLPAILAALWLCGFAVVIAAWFIQWRRIARSIRRTTLFRDGRVVETLSRVEQFVRVAHPIQILSSSGPMEPGVFGIFRPVLLWPEAISPHLDDDQLEAVLAHEACHVRRRDNLTSLIHMLVEAIFWFYPLVWWMESQLVKERERACDEEVVLLCNRPQAYAESILKVCEFCAESPLKCVSGITGADLKRRVVRIVTSNVVRQLSIGVKCLLLIVGLTAVAVPIALGQAKAARRMVIAALTSAPAPVRAAATAIIAVTEASSGGKPHAIPNRDVSDALNEAAKRGVKSEDKTENLNIASTEPVPDGKLASSQSPTAPGAGAGAGAVRKVQPYTAEFTVTTVQTLANGAIITKPTRVVEATDSQRRFLRETTELSASSDQLASTSVMVRDAVDGIDWNSRNQNAAVQKFPPPDQRHGCWMTDTGSLAANFDLIQSPNAAAQKSAVQHPGVEDLGITMINGVEAHGYRRTKTISTGAIGNDAPLVSTDEYWQARSLGNLILREESDDPMTGKQTRQLVSLSLSEPDPAVFQLPAGYQVMIQEMHQVPCQQLAR